MPSTASRRRASSPSRRVRCASCQATSRAIASDSRATARSASSARRRSAVRLASWARAASSELRACVAAATLVVTARCSSASSTSARSRSVLRRACSARRSRTDSAAPSVTPVSSTTAEPSRATATQPAGNDAWMARQAARSGIQTARASRRRTPPVASRRTASINRPPPASATASRQRRVAASVIGTSPDSRSSTSKRPRSAARSVDLGGRDEVRPCPVGQDRLDGRSQTRIHGEVLIEPAAAGLARRPCDRATLLLRQMIRQRFRSTAQPRDRRRGRGRPIGRRGPFRFGRLQRHSARLRGSPGLSTLRSAARSSDARAV